MITVSIKMEGRDEEFFVSFIYTSNTMEEHKGLWTDIRDHHDSPIFRNKPWLIFGDFNEITDVEEHSGFDTSPHIPQGMRNFQDVVGYSSLQTCRFMGRYTLGVINVMNV